MRKYVFLFILLFTLQISYSQSSYSFLDGLMPYPRHANPQEYAQLKQNSQPTYYSPEGKALSEQEKELFIKNHYSFQEFVDKAKTEIKAIIFLPKMESLTIGKMAPTFFGKSLSGEAIDSENLKGTIMVINFWGIECKPCIEEMPSLNQLASEYAGNNEVVFLALSENEKHQIERFLEKRPFHYKQLPITSSTKNLFGITSMPVNIVVDQRGAIQYIKNQYSPTIASDMRKVIDRLLP